MDALSQNIILGNRKEVVDMAVSTTHDMSDRYTAWTFDSSAVLYASLLRRAHTQAHRDNETYKNQ
jgi:hypothetical protein